MKTRYILLSAALCSVTGLGLTSCDNEEFLEVNQYQIVASDALYENVDNAKKGLNGVYDMMMPLHRLSPHYRYPGYWLG